MRIVLLFAFVIVLFALIGHIVAAYRTNKCSWKSMWQNLLATSRQSATILFMKAVAAFGSLVGLSDQFSALFNMPQVNDFLKGAMTPTNFAMVMMFVALIGWLARIRRGSADPAIPPTDPA